MLLWHKFRFHLPRCVPHKAFSFERGQIRQIALSRVCCIFLGIVWVLSSCAPFSTNVPPLPTPESTRAETRTLTPLQVSDSKTPPVFPTQKPLSATSTNVPISSAAPFPTTFLDIGIAYDQDRKEVVLFGGSHPITGEDLDETWTWDGAQWTKQGPPVSPPPRRGGSMAYDPVTRQVLLFGGTDQSGRGFRDTWLWNGETWSQAHPAVSPPPRVFTAMAFNLVRQGVLLFGGVDLTGSPRLSQYINDTWLWDGHNWTQAHPVIAPPANHPALAYDMARQQIILLISQPSGEAPSSETWIWDDAEWVKLKPTNSPPARYGAVMAYDDSRQSIVAFGGYNQPDSGQAGYLTDTWIWDEMDWRQVNAALPIDVLKSLASQTVCTPLQLEELRGRGFLVQSHMVYDVARQRLLLLTVVGGAVPQFVLWAWQGGSWEKLMENPPDLPKASPPGEGWVSIHDGNDLDDNLKIEHWLEHFRQEADKTRQIQDYEILFIDGPYVPRPEYADLWRVYKIRISVKPATPESSFWNDGNGSMTKEGWIINKELALGEWVPYPQACDSWIKIISSLSEYESP